MKQTNIKTVRFDEETLQDLEKLCDFHKNGFSEVIRLAVQEKATRDLQINKRISMKKFIEAIAPTLDKLAKYDQKN
jgi:predicted CopG family antitoxin